MIATDHLDPEWAMLLPTGAVTREFGRFVPDAGMVMGGLIEHAAIFWAVSGELGTGSDVRKAHR